MMQLPLPPFLSSPFAAPGVLTVVNARRLNPETGYSVLSVRQNKEAFTAVCVSPVRIIEGMNIEVHEGRWVNNKKYGRQFHIDRFSIPEPASALGVETYLASGIVRGIGPALAKRVVQAFGEQALPILDAHPERLLEIPGIGRAALKKIVDSWSERRGAAEVLSALCGIGFSVAYAAKALKAFGPNALSLIRENPYVLTKVRGIGFTKADEIAVKMGFDRRVPSGSSRAFSMS